MTDLNKFSRDQLRAEISALDYAIGNGIESVRQKLQDCSAVLSFGKEFLSNFAQNTWSVPTSHDIETDRYALLYYLLSDDGMDGFEKALDVPYSPEFHILQVAQDASNEDKAFAEKLALEEPLMLRALANAEISKKTFVLESVVERYGIDFTKAIDVITKIK